MKKIKFIIILLFIVISLYPKDDVEYRWIKSEIGLRIRENPNLNSKKIRVIPYAEKVILLEETGDIITISGASGKWSRILWENGTVTGWVFGGFLSKKIILNLDKNDTLVNEYMIRGKWYDNKSYTSYYIFHPDWKSEHLIPETSMGHSKGTWKFDIDKQTIFITYYANDPGDGSLLVYKNTITILEINSQENILKVYFGNNKNNIKYLYKDNEY